MASPKTRRQFGSSPRRRSFAGGLLRIILAVVVAFYVLIAASLLLLRWVNPPTTAVQLQRHVEALLHRKAYRKRYEFVPMPQISVQLQHAVVAAEDARFFQHHGFDWKQVQIAVEDDLDKGKSRGASKITQQLVKNLFLTTSRSFVRKGIEFTIVPLAELLLSKRRILELYLNIIEWGPGIYGAEASSTFYFHVPARQLTRAQAIELASIVPAPLRRKPGRLTEYDRIISDRMDQMGW
jgi:monofunctional glycosyltransferase